MNYKLLSKGLVGLLLICAFAARSQNINPVNFSKVEVPTASVASLGTPQIEATNYRVFQMDINALKSQMVGVMHREEAGSGFVAEVTFPHPDGSMHTYTAKENSTMHPILGAMFSEIKTYDGYGAGGVFIKWDITQHGLHAMIMIPGESTIFIDPLIKGNTDYYIVYRKKDFITGKTADCQFNSDDFPMKKKKEATSGIVKSFGTCELRTYRLALSATGEYTTFHGGTVALAQAAQVTTMNRVNGVYERDMAVTMVIVANNNLIIYTNSGSDPFTNGNPGTMINQNQTNTTTVIGSGNYDIGHVFGTNSGGLAGLGVVCNNSQKARGVTGSAAPIGDPFDIDYVAHEMGHQFDCNHTFNNSCGGNRNNATAVEVGSGNTIMAYAGICAPNSQNASDDHFSGKSLEEMGAFVIGSGGSCAVYTPLANNSPTITGTNGNVTVPISTPFALTATATDPDGDVLTYNWEQMDNGISTQSPVATSAIGPNFISNPSLISSTRYFPNLVDLNAGGPFTWEVLPSVSRTMNFRVTVRDNAAGGACNDHADVTVTTDAGTGPFLVLYPSATGITWAGLTSETVTWDVANSDVAPVACANVDILLSTDGGLTFPTVLASNVPNDGSESISVPNIATTTAVIMVVCSNGTFFDISDNNFTITMATFDYSLSATPTAVNICQPNDAVYTVNVGSVGGYNDPVTLSVTGVPAGATSNFSTNPVTPAGTSVLTILNTGAAAPGSYTITITGNSTTGIKTTDVDLVIASGSPSAVAQISPANGAAGVSVPTTFTWTTAPEIGITYEIDIATDAGFASIVDQATGLGAATYVSSILANSTTYYWRARSVTGCGQSAWSSNFSFTTNNCTIYPSADIPKTISAASVTSTIVVAGSGTISDANIPLLDISHVYVGDVSATLTSPLGTVVQLFDGPGIPASTYGCAGDDINASFDDAAALTAIDFENTCNGTAPAISGAFQSMDPMANFNGESITGTWTLTIFDSYTAGDDGVLNDWSLELCTAPVVCTDPDVPTVSGTASICVGTTTTLSIGSGNLNDATDWQWYTGSCGGTSVGSGTSIAVTPGATTTYYVRGEGGCVTPSVCASFTVTVNPTYNETANATICTGQTYTFGTQTLTAPGTYTELFTSTQGCDSLVILTLNVNPTYNETASASICTGQTYIFGTQTLTAAGTYTELFTSVGGCDSLVVLTLSMITAYNETASATICTGQTYTFGTQTLTAPGTYTELFTSAGGCDSTVILTLTVNPTYNETASASICTGQTYTFGTQTLTAPGTYTELFTSTGGCDSTVILTLMVNPTYNETASASICTGQTYTFGIQTLTAPGTYTELFSSISGCDSLVILTLTVNSTYNETASASICTGQTYSFGTQTLTAPGTYTELFTSVGGCDSLVVLTLSTITAYNETANATICAGQTYMFGTQTLTAPGTYTELFTSTGGCDSTVILTLTVNPTYNETASASICTGQTYTFGTQTLTAPGTYTELFSSISGCDSLVILTLTVNSTYNETASASICTGQTYSFGTQTLTAPGTYTELFTSAGGCDSLVVLTLNVSSGYVTNETASICDGNTYTFPDGTIGTTTQVYTSALTSVGGCDSTIVTALTVLQPVVLTQAAEMCEGASYTFPDGSVGTTTQAQTSVLTGANGCDSTIVTALTVHPAYNNTESVVICSGESYTYPDGTTGNTDETHTSLLSTVNGCDSLIITILTVETVDASVTQTGATLTASQTGATYQWIDCDNGNTAMAGETNQAFTASATTGNYAVVVTIGNCSDTSACYLVDYTSIDDIVGGSVTVFPNPTDGVVSITWEGEVTKIEVTDAKGKLIKRVEEFTENAYQLELIEFSSGVYFIHIESAYGRTVHDLMKL